MISKKSIVLLTLATTTAGLLILTQTAASNATPQPIKLEGAWVSRVPQFGNQWTTMFAPTDPSGRSAVIWGALQVSIPSQSFCTGVPPSDSNSDFTGEAVMTGPDTAAFTMVGYSLNQGQIVMTWVTTGEIKFASPVQANTTFVISYYKPEADLNGDGLPEGEPFCVIASPVPTLDTRIGVVKTHHGKK
jgi:hypothetical protein